MTLCYQLNRLSRTGFIFTQFNSLLRRTIASFYYQPWGQGTKYIVEDSVVTDSIFRIFIYRR